MFVHNWHSPMPSTSGGVSLQLYLGFSASLLGLTGFETSANYIEEAGPFETEVGKKGPSRVISVFENTIDSMWYLVMAINPTIAVVTLGVVKLEDIVANQSNILSVVGEVAGGNWLKTLVAIDAICVLCGGVLTAYVGVSGLFKQLAADRCFPAFLLQTNTFAGTNHYIILCFFLLCTALYVVTGGSVVVVSGVFTIAFLLVLLSFAWANIKLKFCRPRLPRGCEASWGVALIGLIVMLVGLIGNIINAPINLLYFLIFIVFFYGVILLSFSRIDIVVMILYFVRKVSFLERLYAVKLCDTLVSMKKHTTVFFAKTSELHILNKAILYTRENELMDRLIICHVHRAGETSVSERLQENMILLDHMYPKIKMDLLLVEADEFSPQLISKLSADLKISCSFFFIRCPGKKFRHNIGEYDGVRTIMR